MQTSTLNYMCALVALLHLCTALRAQEDLPWGFLIGGSHNIQDASFTRLGTYPSCCPTFTDGSGYGLQGGLFYRLGLSSRLVAETRLLASGDGGLFTYDERAVVADLRDTLRVVRATFRHELDASIVSLSLEPLAAYQLSRGLEVLAGPRLSYNLVKHFRQTETLTQPEDYGAYLGQNRTWVATDADIPNTTMLRFAISAGIRATLPSSKTAPLTIGLEALYTHGFSNVTTDAQWSIHHIRLSAVVRFRSRPKGVAPRDSCVDCPTVIAEKKAKVDTLTSAVDTLQALRPSDEFVLSIAAVENGDTSQGQFSIYERSRRIIVLHPLLGHVYFDESSSTLPPRYKEGIARALVDTMNLTPLQALQGELAIIAQRMKSHPDSWLSITGTTSSTTRDEGIRLARARAEEVRSTMNQLGIYDDRMRVSARVYPERPTTFSDTSMEQFAQQENRRVELQSNNPAILAPIKLGARERVHSPERVIVTSQAVNGRDTSTYILRARRGSDIIAEQSLVPSIKDGTMTIDLPTALMNNVGDSLTVEIVSSEQGTPKLHGRKQIPIRFDEQELSVLRSGDLEIERYGLILFEFDEVKISKQHERQLQFIRSRIRENTEVSIIGATDQIGSSEYNQELSLKRAKEVARRLGVQRVRVVGQGEDNPALPNDLPEGRASNRTVIIQLTTPVK